MEFFAGANTANGFVSIFDAVLALAARRSADPSALAVPLAAVCIALGGFAAAFSAVFCDSLNPAAAAAVSVLPSAAVMLAATLVSPREGARLSVLSNLGALAASAALGAYSAHAVKYSRKQSGSAGYKINPPDRRPGAHKGISVPPHRDHDDYQQPGRYKLRYQDTLSIRRKDV